MSTPPGLEARGRSIWAAFSADSLPAGHQALIQELARSADTLDRLAALAAGKSEAWATVVVTDMGDITLTVDSILSELRQQQANFQRLHSEARMAGLKQGAPVQVKDEKGSPGAIILNLRDRIG